jgi:hypothetical protein
MKTAFRPICPIVNPLALNLRESFTETQKPIPPANCAAIGS